MVFIPFSYHRLRVPQIPVAIIHLIIRTTWFIDNDEREVIADQGGRDLSFANSSKSAWLVQ